MPEVKRVYRQKLPEMKLVGKCYTDKDSENGYFGHKWGEWFENDWFSPLKMTEGDEPYEDCDAPIGLIVSKENKLFEYWIGVFLPMDFAVPEGYDSIALAEGDIGVLWIYGKEPDIYMFCSLDRLEEEGYEWIADENGVKYCFERYTCPRFTSPDEEGNVILDMCYYIRGEQNDR